MQKANQTNINYFTSCASSSRSFLVRIAKALLQISQNSRASSFEWTRRGNLNFQRSGGNRTPEIFTRAESRFLTASNSLETPVPKKDSKYRGKSLPSARERVFSRRESAELVLGAFSREYQIRKCLRDRRFYDGEGKRKTTK